MVLMPNEASSCRDVVGFPGSRCGECDACRKEDDVIREGMHSRGMNEGIDYAIELGRVVYSAVYLRKRGWCCNHRCRNCPWRTA